MSDEQKELSIQEEVAAALAATEVESEVPAPGSEAPISEQEDKTAARDDKGRFAPKSEEKTQPDAEQKVVEEEKVEEQTPHLSKDKPPSSWSPTVREKWRDLPEDVRTEIIRREEAGAAGVRKIQEELAPVRHLSESLAAFYDEARQHGVAPQDFNRHVSSTMAAERALRNPDPAGRFEALLGIADTYGIPLRQLLQVPPQAGQQQQPQQPAVPPQVQQELEASRQWREQQLASKAEETVTQWSKGKEFFEDVRQDMAFLVESGRAADLDTAYDMACGMNAEVRKVLETRRGSQDQIKQRQEAAEKANLAKSTSVVEPEVVEDPDDVYSIVRSQMLKSGRT